MLGNDLAQFSKDARDTFAAFNMVDSPPPVFCSKETFVDRVLFQIGRFVVDLDAYNNGLD